MMQKLNLTGIQFLGSPKHPLGLVWRLIFSHLLVVGLTLCTSLLIRYLLMQPLYAPTAIPTQNQRVDLKPNASNLKPAEGCLESSYLFWDLWGGGLAAIGLSYWLARRITQPLQQMETIAAQAVAGNLKSQFPHSSIAEVNRLSDSFSQLTQRLEERRIQEGELLADLVHELRTPITILRGYLEELADERITASAKIYGLMLAETRRLERLVTDLNLLSRTEAGEINLELRPFQLFPLLDAIYQKLCNQLLEDGPTLQLDCPLHLPMAYGDCDRTEQILMNLLSNAIRYTSQGQIVLSAWAESDWLWIAVTDTGHGILPEDLPRVFERFWRSTASRRSVSGGSGVGLTIVKHLVELQGGQVKVESEYGKGSKFLFSLPQANTAYQP